MTTSTQTQTDLLTYVYNNTAPSWAGNTIHVALHVADPGILGTQTTSPATYTGYAQATLAPSSSNFSVLSGGVQSLVDIAFPQNTGTSQTITFVSFGNGTQIYHYGALSNGVVAPGVTPKILAGSMTLTGI